ncbi:SH3 domain-containing protein [Mesorhizobium albiziae]|uniref:SH3 domain-containing protein n=1 Tax=Neomesorhizobium albiziae TaxID=335020 RepID=A0A1I3Y441_9HYPH|nr:DUF1236 domain-containing protein [Mesorhizobium albiziae]GLS30137.1 hypothetical protein GCM10007937_18450 [Mesorhizobium albiziae]SFK26051.1 SH3 domain-containing protein [Mesorhizobium albiziae]
MKPKLVVSAAALGMLAMSGAAFAASATATTDLNIRAGPGPQYEVVGVVGAGQATEITGCLDGSKWCQIASNGGKGWVYSDYLTSDFGGKQVVLTERPANSVTILPPDGGTEGAAVGGATGAVAGALIGGPIGAAVGGVAGLAVGGAAGNAAEPPAQVRTYVTENRVDPVYLDGEVVVGAGIPDNVEIREIPDYEYRYVYVNGQPALVDPGSRRIVYVMR